MLIYSKSTGYDITEDVTLPYVVEYDGEQHAFSSESQAKKFLVECDHDFEEQNETWRMFHGNRASLIRSPR